MYLSSRLIETGPEDQLIALAGAASQPTCMGGEPDIQRCPHITSVTTQCSHLQCVPPVLLLRACTNVDDEQRHWR